VLRGGLAEALEWVEEPLDQVALAVKARINAARQLPVALVPGAVICVVNPRRVRPRVSSADLSRRLLVGGALT